MFPRSAWRSLGQIDLSNRLNMLPLELLPIFWMQLAFLPRGAEVKGLASQPDSRRERKGFVMLIAIIKDCSWGSINMLSLYLIMEELTNVFISSFKLCLLSGSLNIG